jgi:hypothetical protein
MRNAATALALSLLSLGTMPAMPAYADDFAYGPDTCRTGYVWREASPFDHVCVRPASRATAARENAVAFSRIDPAGAYGPFTCIYGFVWREAYAGDVVCVTPARRTIVAQENAEAPLHRTRG